MKHRSILLIVVLLLLICGMMLKPLSCFAGADSGVDMNGVEWHLDGNGTITLNGQHITIEYYQKLNESYSKLVGWGTHKDEIRKIVIEYGAQSVGGCSEMPVLTSVSIPDSVTLLDPNAFGDCPNLVDIKLPDSVTTIKAYAFRNCSSILQMTLPAHLTEINEELFFGCTSLTSVEIPDGVTVIRRVAFANCVSLRQINLPDSIVSIEDSVFGNCTSLTDIILPAGLKSISEYTFAGCAGLSSIVIPDSVKNIGAYAFAGCNALRDIYYTGSQAQWNAITIDPNRNDALTRARIHYNYVPDQASKEEVMLDVNGLLDGQHSGGTDGYGTFDVYIDGTKVKNDVPDFYEYVSAGSTYEIKDIRPTTGHTYQGVSEGALLGTVKKEGTTSIRLSFATIYDIRFNKNTTDTVGNMPGSLKKESGVNLTLPGNIPTREDYTFQGWATSSSSSTVSYKPGGSYTKNDSITLYAVWKKNQVNTVSTVMLDVNGWLDGQYSGGIDGYGTFDMYINGRKVKEDVSDFYEAVAVGSTYEIRDIRPKAGHVFKGVMQDSLSGTVRGTTDIRLLFRTTYDVMYNRNTTDVVSNMPDSQKKEYGVSLTLPGKIPTRSGYTFQGWATSSSSSVVSYKPGGSYTKNAAITLYAVWKKEQAETGAAVRSGQCGDKLTWTLDENGTLTVSGVGNMTDFDNHGAPWYNARNSINKVVISEGVTSIGNNAFDYHQQLKSVSLPDSLKRIGYCAFSATEKLPSIRIPKNVSNIDAWAFIASIGMRSISVENDNPYYSSWDGLLFDKQRTELLCCPAGKDGTVRVLGTVKSIANYAFRGCLTLKGVILPDGLTSIGIEAFWDCRSMTDITIPDSVSSIGDNAFSYCEKLTITVSRNSYAEKYCKNNKLKYISQNSAVNNIRKGDFVTFGTYPKTTEGNDKTPIEWLVLEVKGNEALVISRYGLDAKPYHNTTRKPVTWETCTLRTWLNNDFLNTAFSAAERNAIVTTAVDNSRSHGYQGPSGFNVDAGNNTQDKVFLLSIAEANQYFDVKWEDGGNTASRIEPTAYAIKKGYGTTDEAPAEWRWWWLRSPGNSQYNASVVAPNGSLYASYVVRTHFIRPAFWLNLNAGTFTKQE